MNIAYITEFDIKNTDRTTWQKNQLGHWGCCYYIAKYLNDEQTTIDYVGPLTKRSAILPKVKLRVYNYLHKVYHPWADPIFNKDYASQVTSKLSVIKSDIVLSPDINFISYLNGNYSTAIWVDSTYAGYINYYQEYSNLCRESVKHLMELDKLALEKCKVAIFSSDWAASNAIKNYEIDQAKVKVVPFGANIECNRNIEDIKSLVEARKPNKCKLLFIGSNWARKGGNVALDVAKELNSMGLNTELTVVGCNPVINETLPSFLKVMGVINTFTDSGLTEINKLFTESHFLILPSKADCTPHVLAEANSFGVPCLATNVGGIPTMIKDNLNGKTFAIDANISEYSTYIASLMTNYSQYKQLALSSFKEYQTRLNWSVACQTVKQILSNG